MKHCKIFFSYSQRFEFYRAGNIGPKLPIFGVENIERCCATFPVCFKGQFSQQSFENLAYDTFKHVDFKNVSGPFSDKSAQKLKKCHHCDSDFQYIWYTGLSCSRNSLVQVLAFYSEYFLTYYPPKWHMQEKKLFQKCVCLGYEKSEQFKAQ